MAAWWIEVICNLALRRHTTEMS